ncbi:MAG TPA: hypothetical protein ACN46L_05850, partial [Prochlorococcus sp.]
LIPLAPARPQPLESPGPALKSICLISSSSTNNRLLHVWVDLVVPGDSNCQSLQPEEGRVFRR